MPDSHFWELLSSNQPWNLIFYFGLPLAMLLVVTATELIVLYRQESVGTWKTVNMVAGYLGTIAFAWVFYQLASKVWIPLTLHTTVRWRGWVDFAALTTYLGSFVGWLGMIATDLPWSSLRKQPKRRLLIHAGFLGWLLSLTLVGVFLALLDSRTLGL